MIITPSLLYYLLSQDCSITVITESSAPYEVDKVQLASQNSLQEDTLLICSDVSDIPLVTGVRTSFLVMSSVPEDFVCDKPCASIKTDLSPIELCQLVLETIITAQTWDGMMKDAVHDDCSLAMLFERAHELYPRELMLVDSEYAIVANTEKYFQSNWLQHPAKHYEYLPLEAINDLLLDPEFHKAQEVTGIAIYPSIESDNYHLYTNFFWEHEFVARLLSDVGHGEVIQGEYELFAHVAAYIETAYLHQSTNLLQAQQSDQFHSILASMLDGNTSVDPALCKTIFQSQNWLTSHEF